MPRLHIKGDPNDVFVSLIDQRLVFRFVCIKHRRNLVHSKHMENPSFVPINRETGITGMFESERVETIGNVPIIWDIDLTEMFCPENPVDTHPDADCADFYRVMTEELIR